MEKEAQSKTVMPVTAQEISQSTTAKRLYIDNNPLMDTAHCL